MNAFQIFGALFAIDRIVGGDQRRRKEREAGHVVPSSAERAAELAKYRRREVQGIKEPGIFVECELSAEELRAARAASDKLLLDHGYDLNGQRK